MGSSCSGPGAPACARRLGEGAANVRAFSVDCSEVLAFTHVVLMLMPCHRCY